MKNAFALSVISLSLLSLNLHASPVQGEIVLPKPAQHQLGIRTLEVQREPLHRVIELNGKVVLDPQSGGLVQTATGGQFVPSESGIPALGQRVKKGQILGYIQKPQNPLELATQQAQLAQLKSQLTLSEQRVERISQLADTLPKKELDAARAEALSLKQQVSALSKGLHAREALRAPSSGIIASSNALSGQVFSEKDTLFEVINPNVLRIEASWFEPHALPQFSKAYVQAGNQNVTLQYQGAAHSLKEQTLLLTFEARQLNSMRFPTGQLLKLYAEQANTVEGVAIPNTALVKNASNQNIVWIKKSPETFEPRLVITEPLNGTHLVVRTGLSTGERLVVQGVTLLNQVR